MKEHKTQYVVRKEVHRKATYCLYVLSYDVKNVFLESRTICDSPAELGFAHRDGASHGYEINFSLPTKFPKKGIVIESGKVVVESYSELDQREQEGMIMAILTELNGE